MKRLLVLLLCGQLAACGFLSSTRPEPTLSDLEPVRLPEADPGLPSVSLEELEEVYRQVLAVTPDPETRVQVLHRLADIEMSRAEGQLVLGDDAGASDLFDRAIESYQALLQADPDAPGNDQLLYQMSKAYDLAGDPDQSIEVLERLSRRYPQSPHFTEAEFRVAESYFAAGSYARAEAAYRRVTEQGNDTPYYRNAIYMYGWAQFKQGQYRRSIAAFSNTLDLLLPPDNDLEKLSAGERELAQDSFRVLAVVFSYLEGPDTIAAAYDQLGHRSYQYLLYEHLGELYLRQQRYRDSAETYRAFNRLYPDSSHAHRFQVAVIEIYQTGGFPDLIILEKQHYIDAYGVGGRYWNNSSGELRAEIEPNLKLFIDEMATHYHALAQAATERELAVENYLVAGNYYELYINSFSEDPRVPEMGFLLGESRSEAGDHGGAISAWEWVAYEFPEYEKAADAGYAAILSYEQVLAVDGADPDAGLRRARVDSQLRFASVFASDERTPPVLKDAASSLFDMQEYQLAIISAATLARVQPTPGEELMVPAWLVIGHSYFELQDYLAAEQGYRRALGWMPVADERQAPTVERLAATLYLQGEEAVAAEDFGLAASLFASVIEVAPDSQIRIQAQFDAAANYMAAARFEEANQLLLDFRHRFPSHELSAGVAVKLVHNYEQLELWQEAAVELDAMMPNEAEPERQRQMLFLAAEYYDKAGQEELARLRFRSYAHDWPQPLAPRLEAMSRLGEIYEQRGEGSKRRFWLRKIMKAHDAAGEEQTPRSLFLAASASSVFADDEYRAYQRIAIRHPIAKSLKKKSAAMKKAIGAYQSTNDYGVAQFSTLATYRMGEIYRGLSQDLLNSERPDNLDELALEQYDILLEEQAYPFEEKAIAIHESNARRSWEGLYDEWVRESFAALALLSPVRYAKTETSLTHSREIF